MCVCVYVCVCVCVCIIVNVKFRASYFCLFLHSYSFPGHLYAYLPTPPLGQDMTQDQFLSGV